MASKRPEETEASIQGRLEKALFAAGWTVVDKTHGDAISAGWPDLYCYHGVRKLHRWVEVKRPGRKGHKNCFEPAQLVRFARWDRGGHQVYVMCDTDLSILYNDKGNWKEWLHAS